MAMVKTREEYNAYMNDYMKRRWAKRRAALVASLGGVCAHCGSTNELDFDHIDPSTKVSTIGSMSSASDARIAEEIAKCQLLCAVCHNQKTLRDKGLTNAKNHTWYDIVVPIL